MNRRQRRASTKLGQPSVQPAAAGILALGLQYHRAGRLAAAEECYRRVLATQPNHPEAIGFIGMIAYQLGRYDAAVEWIGRAIRLNGKNPAWFSNIGAALERQGKFEQALANYDKAIALKPDYAEAFNNRGNALKGVGRLDEALASYDKALAVDPNSVQAHNNRGAVLADVKRFDEALSSYDRALALSPDLTLARKNRGNLLQALGRLDEALADYDRALASDPGYADAIVGRGSVLLKLNRIAEAEKTLRRAILLKPGVAEVYLNLGTVLVVLGRLVEAEQVIRRAVELEPGNHAALHHLGRVLVDLDRLEEAELVARRALALKPDDAEAHLNLGNVLMKLGRPDQAGIAYRRAVGLKSDLAEAHHNLAVALMEIGRLTEARKAAELAVAQAPWEPVHFLQLGEVRKYAADDPYLAALEALSENAASLGTGRQIALHFALAKAYADIGRTEDEFGQLLTGNRLKRGCVDYDERLVLAGIDRARQVFSSEFMSAAQGVGEPSPKPIFIVGMPRSGTTLVEQILASHPEVVGAGELNFFERATADIHSALLEAPAYPEIALHMSGEHFRELGGRYLAGIRQLAPAASHITDKMPANFVFAGLIHLALPNATIVHTVRNPVDTCISCFSKLFTAGNCQTYDLAELGRYYRHYQALMAHWHSVLPPGRILDVNYEDVVGDLEGVARRLVAHCGLPWDPRCLDFHRTERAVRTASAAQVRQPIYPSSVGRRRAYEPFLEPLLAELLPSEAG